MSARTAMRHRCSIQRNTAATDTWGGPGAPGWTAHLTDQPCRVWFNTGSRIEPPGEDIPLLDIRLLLPAGTDVIDDDRILRVLDRLGRTVLEGPLLIDVIGYRKDHLELMLKETP